MDKRITGETDCLRYLTRQAGGGFWYHKRISQQDRKRKNEAVKGASGNSAQGSGKVQSRSTAYHAI